MFKYLLVLALASSSPAAASEFTYTPNEDEFAQTKNWTIQGLSDDGQWALSFGNLLRRDQKYDERYVAITIQPEPRGPTCDGVFLSDPLDLEWYAIDAAGNRGAMATTVFKVSNYGDGTFLLITDGPELMPLLKGLISNASIRMRYKDNCGDNTTTFSLESVRAALARAKADKAF